jgi:hypothetical protein
MVSETDQAALNRFEDALATQASASNPSGMARTLIKAINACKQENV